MAFQDAKGCLSQRIRPTAMTPTAVNSITGTQYPIGKNLCPKTQSVPK
jgi:hypothetical protein